MYLEGHGSRQRRRVKYPGDETEPGGGNVVPADEDHQRRFWMRPEVWTPEAKFTFETRSRMWWTT